MEKTLEIVDAHGPERLDDIRELFSEYVETLGFDLDFQDYEREYGELPGEYAPPDGRLLLALYGSKTAGCVALRKFAEGDCEMKRLYVRREFRGKGVGRALAVVIIDAAKKMGYRKMMLDTVPSMVEALALYRSLGFSKRDPYRYNPVDGAVFMELYLD
jgi:ribosomal protein S18 acetylase RimI-like enzyme